MKIGYACLVEGKKELAMRSCTLKNATEEKLREITEHNLTVLDRILDYNIENGILLFRISSDLIPFASKKEVEFPWQRLYANELQNLGEKALKGGLRLSMHPGQYTVLNSPNPDVVERAVLDLEYHTEFLDLCGLKEDSKVILHIGGIYGNKVEAKQRFVENYNLLSPNIRKRLIIENDDKLYHVEDVLEIANIAQIPVVFDVLHHKVNPPAEEKKVTDWIRLCGETWKHFDGVPKIHYSQQWIGNKAGSHSKTICLEEFMKFYQSVSTIPIDIMLEVKDKNLSAVKCILGTSRTGTIRQLEKEWANYKYTILEHSPKHYQEIRSLLKDKNSNPVYDFYRLVEEAMELEPARGHVINAFQHVWGYFKEEASEPEKVKFLKELTKYELGEIGPDRVKRYLEKLLDHYPNTYLSQSYYFSI